MVYSSYPWHPYHLEDPKFYDQLGRDPMTQMRVYMLPSEDEQACHVLEVFNLFPKRGLDILFDAALRGKAKVVSALLNAGVQAHPAPGSEDEEKELLPIHTAAARGHLECVQVLVDQGGVDPDDEFDGLTPVMRAAIGGHAPLLDWLLHTGCVDLWRKYYPDHHHDEVALGVLEMAAEEGHADCVETIVAFATGRGVAPARDLVSKEALKRVGMSGNLELALRMLTWAGVPAEALEGDAATSSSPDLRLDKEQRLLIEITLNGAARQSHVAIVRRLLGVLETLRGPLVSPTILTASIRRGVVRAAARDDVRAFTFFLELAFGDGDGGDGAGPEAAARSSGSMASTLSNALFLAADENALTMTRRLVEEYGVDPNDGSQNPCGLTPLMEAAGRGHFAVAAYLLQSAGADAAVGAGPERDTALWFAVKGGHADVALLLLRHGAPVDGIVSSPAHGHHHHHQPRGRILDFSRPADIFMRLIRFSDGAHGVKVFLDEVAAAPYAEDAARGAVDIHGLTPADAVWWEQLRREA